MGFSMLLPAPAALTAAAPADLATAAAVGDDELAARADHVHRGLTVAAPAPLALVGAVGAELAAARGDHAHARGTTPSARVRLTSQQALNNGSWTTLVFQVADLDTSGFWSAASPGRLIVPAGLGGLYVIEGAVVITANTTGARGAGIRKNGTGTSGPTFGHNTEGVGGNAWGFGIIAPPAIARLVAGDYVELLALCNVAGLNAYSEDGNSHLALARIGD